MPPVLKASGNIKIIGKTKHCRHQAVFFRGTADNQFSEVPDVGFL